MQKLEGERVLMRILLSESDKYNGKLAYEEIIKLLRERHLAGATLLRGSMSFGSQLMLAARRAFDRAAAEFVLSQRYNSDQPGSHIVLGAFYLQRNELDSAATEFKAALRLQPQMPQADSGFAAISRMRANASTVVR